MPMRFMTRGRSAAGFTTAAALLLTLSACSSGSPIDAAPSTAAAGLPSSHIHGLSVNRDTDQVLLATHEGLFDITKSPGTQIGDTNDLMASPQRLTRVSSMPPGTPAQAPTCPIPWA